MRCYGVSLVTLLLMGAAVCRRRFAVTSRNRSSVAPHLRTFKCWALVVAVFCTSFGYLVPYLYVVPYGSFHGLSDVRFPLAYRERERERDYGENEELQRHSSFTSLKWHV